MKTIQLFCILILFLCPSNSLLNAQSFTLIDDGGFLYKADISEDCSLEPLGQIRYYNEDIEAETNLLALDIAIHPNGDIYAVAGSFAPFLYRVDPNTYFATEIGRINGFYFLNALVFDDQGRLFGAAQNQLIRINLNTGSANSIATLRATSSGDLAYNDGYLYLVCEDNILLRIDPNFPEANSVVGFYNIPGSYFGMVTIQSDCEEPQTLATSDGDLFRIDVTNAETEFFCFLSNAEIFGAAYEDDHSYQSCFLNIDLDFDDSSGAIGSDFLAPTPACNESTSKIADFDVEITGNVSLDTIVVQITNPLDGSNERLILNGTVQISVQGSGSQSLKLINNGNATANDFISLIQAIVYQNGLISFSSGQRAISVQLFSKDGFIADPVIGFVNLSPASANNIQYFPNPVFRNLNVNFEQSCNDDAIVSIEVYNVLGQLLTPEILISTSFGNSSAELDLSYLAAGAYFVKTTIGGEDYVEKIIKLNDF